MSTLLQEIEAQIAGAKTATAKQNVGLVREIGDGVAKVEGLTDAMLNEMLDFGKGVVGLALNLEENEVGAIIHGDYTKIAEGDEVRTTGKLLQVPVGKPMLGRVVNALGLPVDGKGPIKTDAAYPVALRHGAGERWLDLELDLWKALTATVRKWDREMLRTLLEGK